MRVLVLHLYDKEFQLGGADKIVLDLSSALQIRHGHEIRILTNQGFLAEEATKRNMQVIEISSSKLSFWKTVKIIREQINSFHPEIFHSHHRFMTLLLNLFFKKRGLPILHMQQVQTWDKKLFFRYGDFMTTASESLRRHMNDFYKVPEGRIRAIVNAVPLKPPAMEAVEQLKKQFPRRSGELFALCAARFHAQKGHVYLIDAVEKLKLSDRKRIRIFLAGDGSLEQEMRRRIEQKHLKENFVFLGYRKDIPELLEFCDFLILPSLWEGLPLVILEAFAMGKPALATDIPGNSDVLKPRQNGLLVPPQNPGELAKAICFFLDQPTELEKMQKGARADSKSYSFESMVQNYHDLYQELVHKGV